MVIAPLKKSQEVAENLYIRCLVFGDVGSNTCKLGPNYYIIVKTYSLVLSDSILRCIIFSIHWNSRSLIKPIIDLINFDHPLSVGVGSLNPTWRATEPNQD